MTEPAAGRYPRVILGTCVIPWQEKLVFDEPLFRRTVRAAVATLTPHLYVFGTAGEGYAVTDRQFVAITRAFVEEMNRAGGTPMVGVISLSLGTIIERIEFAHALGVREFQLSLPSWGALNDRELDTFFAETCGRFPDARFLHYNLARARRVLQGRDYAWLASRHPNLVAVKMGGDPDTVAAVAAAVPQLRFFCTEFTYLALADRIACGLLCAVTAASPALARRLFASSAPERALLQPTLRALHSAVKLAVGETAHMDGAYDKLYARLLHPEFPLRLLPPYAGASEAAFAEFRAACAVALQDCPRP